MAAASGLGPGVRKGVRVRIPPSVQPNAFRRSSAGRAAVLHTDGRRFDSFRLNDTYHTMLRSSTARAGLSYGSDTGSIPVGATTATIAVMLPGPDPSVPSMNDAEKAAQALKDIGAGMVILFGSVADGTQGADSDIDLVAIFDDLGDYSTRDGLKSDAEAAARDAAGFWCDVLVTDRAEWAIRSEMAMTIEHLAKKSGRVLLDVPPDPPPDMSKQIGQPSTVLGESLQTIYAAMIPIEKVLRRCRRTAAQSSYCDTDIDGRFACESAAMAATIALRTYIKNDLQQMPQLQKSTGRFRSALRQLPPDRRDVFTSMMQVDPSDIDKWLRELWYDPPSREEVSLEYMRKMSLTAGRVCRFVLELVVPEPDRPLWANLMLESVGTLEEVAATMHRDPTVIPAKCMAE